jgi:hypothetical protein
MARVRRGREESNQATAQLQQTVNIDERPGAFGHAIILAPTPGP